MRYILDNEGYIEDISFGAFIECNNKGCTEYTGNVPAGFGSLCEWADNANIRAFKIVEGNLVYDPNRCSILETQFEKEAEDNRYVCHKEISNITNMVKTDSVDAYKRSTTNLSNILEVTDSNKYASDYIKLVANENITGSVTLKFNNGNLLTNDATSKYESGISFAVNADRSITIYGAATEDIEFNIGGTNTNVKPILTFKKNTNYYLSSNGYQIKMYNYDGTDRTEVYNGTGGIINLSSDSKVTNIVLAIASGTTINTTIYPMLNLGTEAKEYVTYQGNESTIYLGENTFTPIDIITIDFGEVLFKTIQYPSSNKETKNGLTPSETLMPSETLEPSNKVMETFALYPSNETYVGYKCFIQLDDVIMPTTYLNFTYMYCMENVDLMVTYPNIEKDLDLCGYETPNSGFAIDEEGNMYCNNATIRGAAIINGSKFSVDEEGNMICNNANVSGRITSSDGTIGDWDINNDGLSNNNGFYIKHGIINFQNQTYNFSVSNVYTMSDILICQSIILGVLPTPEVGTKTFKHYDINNNGQIDAQDLLIIQKILGNE